MKEQINNDQDFSYNNRNFKPPDEKDGFTENKSYNNLYDKYRNYKWKEPEKLRNGPYGDESRKCRDCLCCIIFIIFFIGCLLTAFVGFLFGKPKRILYSYDEDGNACGYDEGYKDYKLLYFYDVLGNLEKFKISKIVNAFCVRECPSNKYNKNEYKNKNIFLD